MKKLILFFALPFLTISCSAYNADSIADIYQVEEVGNKMVVWKNDKKLPFEIISNNHQIYFSDIFVKDNDFYYMAYEAVEEGKTVVNIQGRNQVGIKIKNICKLWKNGELIFESSFSVQPYKIFVTDNNDVYFVGNASVWKNGIERKIEHKQKYCFIKNLFVVNDNVYVVGHDYFNAMIDINGEMSYLEKDTASSFMSDARAVFVVENDVYVAGSTRKKGGNDIAVLWKNFEPQHLTDGKYFGNAEDVVVVGTNVYVAGYEENKKGNKVAMLWKNGVVQKLEGGENIMAQKIYAVGNDIYVLGKEKVFSAKFPKGRICPRIWKNGKKFELYRKDCLDVFVVAKEKE